MRFVVGVSGPAEARTALANGADAVMVGNAAALAGTIAAAGERDRVFAAAGRFRMEPHAALSAVGARLTAGTVTAGMFPAARNSQDAVIGALAGPASQVRLVAVLFADNQPDLSLLPALRAAGFAGAVLGVLDDARLLDCCPAHALARFAAACRSAGLSCGFAGGLEAPDVPRLAVHRPDHLMVRSALFAGGPAGSSIDGARVAAFAGLVNGGRRTPEPPGEGAVPRLPDRIFVRDLVEHMEVGAYGSERGRRQRVRFSVEADVLRPPAAPQAIADIYSYDIIIDAIRALAAAEHTEFVETLAEELAATLLRDGRVRAVSVRVEKLDLGPAAAGIEIRREKQ